MKTNSFRHSTINSFSMAEQTKSDLVFEVSRSRTIRHAHAHTHTHTPDRISLKESPAVRRGRYLHITSKLKRRTSIPSARIEPAIPAIKRLQTYALNRACTRPPCHAATRLPGSANRKYTHCNEI